MECSIESLDTDGWEINRGRQLKGWRDELQQYWRGGGRGMRTCTREQETETFGGNMLSLSSCSGLIMAEDDGLFCLVL